MTLRLAVVIPSRGLIHSRTIAAVHREADATGWEWRIFWAHGRPIPACFNEPAAEAIQWGADRVWFVEEDMHLPPGILTDLAAAADRGHAFAAADYPVTPAGTLAANRDGAGVVRYTGTGCLLADAHALNALLPFTADWQYAIRSGAFVREPAQPGAYGLHDVEFGMRLYNAGTPAHVVPTLCSQYRVRRPATAGTNADGWHDIRLITDT